MYVDQPDDVPVPFVGGDVLPRATLELAVAVEELVEAGGTAGDVVAETGLCVLLASGVAAQPAARPVRHRPTSSVWRRR